VLLIIDYRSLISLKLYGQWRSAKAKKAEECGKKERGGRKWKGMKQKQRERALPTGKTKEGRRQKKKQCGGVK